MSTFGRLLRVTTFGESHGAGVGCIVDGIPGAQRICVNCVRQQLVRRRPGGGVPGKEGQTSQGAPIVLGCTPRFEADEPEFLSGVEDGLSLGSPICILIKNTSVRRQDYALVAGGTASSPDGPAAEERGTNEHLSTFPRPGHAELTYLIKYGICSQSGGGRSSARETAARVAAGALVESCVLRSRGVDVVAFVCSVGNVALPPQVRRGLLEDMALSREAVDSEGDWVFDLSADKCCSESLQTEASEWQEAGLDQSVRQSLMAALKKTSQKTSSDCSRVSLCRVVTRCPHKDTSLQIAKTLLQAHAKGDSVGCTVSFAIRHLPPGIGEPVFDKLPALLAYAMMSLPASKGFEVNPKSICSLDRFIKERASEFSLESIVRSVQMGEGFGCVSMTGSLHNDAFQPKPTNSPSSLSSFALSFSTAIPPSCCCGGGTSQMPEQKQFLRRAQQAASASRGASLLQCSSNHAGGTLGGISSGETVYGRVAFKPPSSIALPQKTCTLAGTPGLLEVKGRHDPCVASRAVPVVEAMAALVVGDLLLQNAAKVQAKAASDGSSAMKGL